MSENGLSHMQACVAGNSMPHEISSLSYTQNGSINDPSKPHGLSLIHRVSDTPLGAGAAMRLCSHGFAIRAPSLNSLHIFVNRCVTQL